MNSHAYDIEINSVFDLPNHTGSPERRLLMAIFERALLDFVGNDKKEYEEAKEWLFESLPYDLSTQFSFPWICHQLDLNIEDIRKKIATMPRRGASRIAPWYLTKGYKAKESNIKDLRTKNFIKKNNKKLAKIINFSNIKEEAFVN